MTIAKQLLRRFPHIAIDLDNHFDNKIYTPSSFPRGFVRLNIHPTTPFASVQIQLLGRSKVFREGHASNFVNIQTFLEMAAPETILNDKDVQKGEEITIPFAFITPTNLVDGVCKHKIYHDSIKKCHHSLPPTTGYWGKKSFLMPSIACIEYAIVAIAFYRGSLESGPRELAKVKYPITFMPDLPELAPLLLTPGNTEYSMSKYRRLRHGATQGKTDLLMISAIQPNAIILETYGTQAFDIRIHFALTFESVTGETRPPAIANIASKLETITYFSVQPFQNFPNLAWKEASNDHHSGRDRKSVPLKTCGYSLSWHRSQVCRSYTYGSEQNNAELDHQMPPRSGSLVVLVNIPRMGSRFIPTYHSCFISRVYVIKVRITLESHKHLVLRKKMTFKIPVQIVVRDIGVRTMGIYAWPNHSSDVLTTFDTAPPYPSQIRICQSNPVQRLRHATFLCL